MTVKDVKDTLKARVLTGEELMDQEVRSACGSDMMSDVLAFPRITPSSLPACAIPR